MAWRELQLKAFVESKLLLWKCDKFLEFSTRNLKLSHVKLFCRCNDRNKKKSFEVKVLISRHKTEWLKFPKITISSLNAELNAMWNSNRAEGARFDKDNWRFGCEYCQNLSHQQSKHKFPGGRGSCCVKSGSHCMFDTLWHVRPIMTWWEIIVMFEGEGRQAANKRRLCQ